MDDQGRVMAVTVRADGNDGFEFSKPEPLFTFVAATPYGLDREFDVSRNGERFLFHSVPGHHASHGVIRGVGGDPELGRRTEASRSMRALSPS